MSATIARILESLEAFHGPQEAAFPSSPYSHLVWLQCGYPASDDRCSRGWESLRKMVGVDPYQILGASLHELTRAVAPGGMIPELRAKRLREVATRVIEECSGDLSSALACPLPSARKLLKKFPTVGDPGADRILLFAGLSPIAAAPSNNPQVIVRIMRGREQENYNVSYKEAQEELGRLPESVAERIRAYLLLRRHGQELCKRQQPQCSKCPIRDSCAFHVGHHRGRPTDSQR